MVAAGQVDPLQEWLDRAVSLRADMLRSEVAFFEYLMEGEDGTCPWQGHYTSFIQLLETTNLCSPQRYAAFRDSYKKLDAPTATKVEVLGVDGVMETGRMEKPARDEFVKRVEQGAKAQGCPLSPRRIKEIGKEVAPKKSPKRKASEPKTPTMGQLQAENAKLKKLNAKLEEENKKLRAKVDELKAKLARRSN